eukprot:11227406-Lingulodinium_polyedra.AAC.1
MGQPAARGPARLCSMRERTVRRVPPTRPPGGRRRQGARSSGRSSLGGWKVAQVWGEAPREGLASRFAPVAGEFRGPLEPG